ncbi:MAG: glycosyltransferase [Anaerolineales bacterium]|nr:glycosyltransferase [Anaerolineales bacterium]
MPEITVSMPAYNTAKFIAQAIQSVLDQKNVDFELIVVDDGSTDTTSLVVQSFDDPRIKLIRNETNRGISYCHNMVIDRSDSPFISIVDSDDWIAPGAFSKMLDKIKSSPDIGQVHCNFYDIDGKGRASAEDFRTRRRQFRYRSGMNYRRELLIHGSVMNHLRTYRREVFVTIGKFNEELWVGEDLEMALRLLECWEIALVPEYLYYRRRHSNNTSNAWRFLALNFWFQRVAIIRRLIKRQQARYLLGTIQAYWLLFLGLIHVLQIPAVYYALKRYFYARKGLRGIIRREVIQPLGERSYDLVQRAFSWWPVSWFGLDRTKLRKNGKHIAYYLWRFPALSETFIRREITALIDRGFDVKIIADAPVDLDKLDWESESLLKRTLYLLPEDSKQFYAYRKKFIRRNPLKYLNLALYLVFHRYGYHKTLLIDRELFRKTVYLAGVLDVEGIDHVHSPWADQSAFVAMIASRLIGAHYSVQARAFDIYRKSHAFSLREKFKNASFVITGCMYNRDNIRAILKSSDEIDIHVIYEGINTDRIRTERQDWKLSGPIKLLCVSRLVEKKGLEYLLKACKHLEERGIDYQCNVIGAFNKKYTDHNVRLIKLYRELMLFPKVVFVGTLPFDRVMDAYKNADIFILPCVLGLDGDRDVTPNTLIEAMAYKIPVISTWLSAIPEIVEDKVNGILVPLGDEQALSDAIVTLAQDAELRKMMGESGRKRVLERFDITKNINQYVDLFNS